MPKTLTIEIDDHGKLNISGPIANKLLTYGMLEMAKDAVHDFHSQQERRVQIPSTDDLAALGGVPA